MFRLGFIVLALALMGAIAADLVTRAGPGRRAAMAIADGYSRTAAVTAEAVEDSAIGADEDDAGYRWAARRVIDRMDACPSFSAPFRRGCETYVLEEMGDASDAARGGAEGVRNRSGGVGGSAHLGRR